jgi:hypothetical protein
MWQRSSYLTKELCSGKEFGCLPLCIGGFFGPLCNPSRPFAELGQGKATSTGNSLYGFSTKTLKRDTVWLMLSMTICKKKKKKKKGRRKVTIDLIFRFDLACMVTTSTTSTKLINKRMPGPCSSHYFVRSDMINEHCIFLHLNLSIRSSQVEYPTIIFRL